MSLSEQILKDVKAADERRQADIKVLLDHRKSLQDALDEVNKGLSMLGHKESNPPGRKPGFSPAKQAAKKAAPKGDA